MPSAKPKIKRTERELLDLLRQRHAQTGGNGEAFAVVEHVRNAASFDANRTIDALAFALWKSNGLTIDAFEIKCSRSDFLREIKDPSKAEAFVVRADRFWLVVGDSTIATPAEVPDGWGLLVAQGSGDTAKLVQKVPAAQLHTESGKRGAARPLPPGIDRSYLAALMRAAVRSDEASRRAAINDEVRRQVAAARDSASRDRQYAEQERDRLREVVTAFEREAGVRLSEWAGEEDAAAVGRAVKIALVGEEARDDARRSLERTIEGLRRAADHLERDAGLQQEES